MNRKIYISTNAFQTKDLNTILNICEEDGLKNLELSICDNYDHQIYTSLVEFFKEKYFRFLFHNYFPPSSEPFVLNLASNNPDILSVSRQHCLNAITLSAELGAPFYSVHAGACFHLEPEQLGKDIDKYSTFPRDEAQETLLESVQGLADHASEHDMVLAIENHVLTSNYLIEGKNELLLGVTAEEILDVISSTQRENVAALIDLGHLKVSAKTLGFSPHNFIRDLSPHTIALHLSDNNGFLDEHKSVLEDSWFWEILCTYISRDIFWILEVHECSISQIIDQVMLISSHFKKLKEI